MYCKIKLLNPLEIKNIRIVTKEEILYDIEISRTENYFFGLVSEKGKILKLGECLSGKEEIELLDKSQYKCDSFQNSEVFVLLQPHTFIVEEVKKSELIYNYEERKIKNSLSYKLSFSLESIQLEYNTLKRYLYNLEKLIEQEKSLESSSQSYSHLKQLKLNRKKIHKECSLLKYKLRGFSILYNLFFSKYKDIWQDNT